MKKLSNTEAGLKKIVAYKKACVFYQAFFSTLSKSHNKNLNTLRTKKAFKIRLKTFFINFKGLSLKQIRNFGK